MLPFDKTAKLAQNVLKSYLPNEVFGGRLAKKYLSHLFY